MYKVLKNKRNLYTLLRYRVKAETNFEKSIMNSIIDDFSRDFNVLNEIKLLPNTPFFECLTLDLELE